MGLVKYWDPADSERPNFPAAGEAIDFDGLGMTLHAATDFSEFVGSPITGEEVFGDVGTVRAQDSNYSLGAELLPFADAGAAGGTVARAIIPEGWSESGAGPGPIWAAVSTQAVAFQLLGFGFSSPYTPEASGNSNKIIIMKWGAGQIILQAQPGSPSGTKDMLLHPIAQLVDTGQDDSGRLEANLDLSAAEIDFGERGELMCAIDSTRNRLICAWNGVIFFDRVGTDGYTATEVFTGHDQSFDMAGVAMVETKWHMVHGGGVTVTEQEQWQEVDEYKVWTGPAGSFDSVVT